MANIPSTPNGKITEGLKYFRVTGEPDEPDIQEVPGTVVMQALAS